MPLGPQLPPAGPPPGIPQPPAALDFITPARLARADKQAERVMRPFRKNRASAITEYMGRWYDDEDNKKRPLNLLAQYANVIIPNLIGRLPVNTPKARNPMLRFEATLLGLALDDLQERLDLYTTFRTLAFDGIFGPCAICKVGIKAGNEIYKVDGKEYDPGGLYVSPVDLDDFAFDPAGRRREEVRWERHRYRPSRQAVLDSGIFSGKEDKIMALPLVGRKQGDENPSQRDDERPEKYAVDCIELVDFALYSNGVTRIVTLPGGKAMEGQTEFLADYESMGPDGGPYEVLMFHPVSTQYMGVPPVAFIRDVAEAGERIANKMIRQAERAKQIFAYTKGASDDAMTIKKAADGDSVGVDNAESMKPIVFGGVDAQNYDFSAWLGQTFNNLSGSAQMLAGSEKIADTATEAQIMQANASARLREMKDRMDCFMDKVNGRLGWFLTVDKLIELPLAYRMPGGDVIEAQYSAETRKGCWFDFNWRIRRGSAVGIDPMVRIKRIGDMLTVLQNFVPLAQTTGLVNLTGLARLLGTEYDVDQLDEIVNDPVLAMQTQMIAGALPQPPNGPVMPGGMGGGGVASPPTPPGVPAAAPPPSGAALAPAGRMGGSPQAPRPDSANPSHPAVRGGFSQGGKGS